MTVIATICPFCGVGCGMGLHVRQGRVIGVEPIPGHPVSQGQLCSKGWNVPFAIEPEGRLTRPLIREKGGFREAEWDEAIRYIADTLKALREDSGAERLGLISCARATNEDNYAAQKFARAVLGTHNVDHCARICHSPSVAGLQATLGSGAMTNSMADVEATELIVVWGADATENHAVFGGRILRAWQQGAGLIVVDPRRTRLASVADLHLQPRIGTTIALANGLLHLIFANGWEDRAFLAARVDNVDVVRAAVAEWTPAHTEAVTGVPAAQLLEAARRYAQADTAFLCYGMGVTQFSSGTNNVIALANLVLACGQVGRPGTGINPLRGQNNVQGACDMGCLPNVYPGYQAVSDAAVRDKFAAAWGISQPTAPGLTSLGMTKAAEAGDFRALIICGEDPVVTDPDQNHVGRALRRLDLLVVLELTLTETAKLADVVLPVASFAEKDGTFTNCERRVQLVRQAVPAPGECRADWQIFVALAQALGASGFDWPDAASIYAEMAALSPIFSGISHTRLQHHGLQWPVDAAHPEGALVLHRERFPLAASGRARMLPVHQSDLAEPPDAEFPLCLTTQRLSCQYGCGSMTRRAPLLEREVPGGLLFMHPDDAAHYGLPDGAPVGVRSRRGYLETRVQISDVVPAGVVSLPYHFREAPSNQLTCRAEDPVTHMPELKACAVRVEPLSRPPRPIQLIPLGERLREAR